MIRILNSQNFKVFKDIRLTALQTDPDAFSAYYKDEQHTGDAQWMKKLENGSTTLAWETSDKILAGIVRYSIGKGSQQHTAQLYGCYVREEYRRQGIFTKLLTKALTNIDTRKEVMRTILYVNQTYDAALSLRAYEKFGFKQTSFLERAHCLADGTGYLNTFLLTRETFKEKLARLDDNIMFHVVHQGQTFCDFMGNCVSKDWPPGHRFRPIEDWELATCPVCRKNAESYVAQELQTS